MDPNYPFAMQCLQMTLALKKDPEALALAKKMLDVSSGDAYFVGQLGWTYGLLDNKEQARRILEQLQAMPVTQPAPPPAVYYAYMGLRDRKGTLEWMEKAYTGRWSDMVWIKAGPEYDWLRDDPKFQSLLRKLKLDG
jgi:adenylate cyclase